MTIYTEDLCVGGIATASASWSSWVPANAFDNNITTGWHHTSYYPYPAILRYQFPTARRIKKYTLRTRVGTDNYQCPITWTFEGSNDASNWVVLDSHTNLDWGSTKYKEFTFENNNYYLYYKLNVTVNYVDDSLSIIEMEMMEEVVQTPKPLNSIYNVGHRGNLRGKAKQGFIRPTIKEFFTSTNYLPTNKS